MNLVNISIKSGNEIINKNCFLSLFIWYLAILLLIIISITKESIIPNYFFFDANTISDFIRYSPTFRAGDSFSSTAAFYDIFNIDRYSLVFSIISSMIIIIGFFFYIRVRKSITLIEFSLLFFYMLLSVIYMTLLSKDFIVLLFVLPFLKFAKRGWVGLVLWSALAGVYAYFFRSYWILFLVLFWSLYLSFNLIRNCFSLLMVSLISLFAIAIVLQLSLGVDVDNFRTIVNDVRLGQGNENANSMILPFVGGGGVLIGWINVSITWLSFMVPLPLVLSFSPYYLVISLLLMMLYYKFWKSVNLELKKRKCDRDKVKVAVSCLVLAFTLIQSLFEPDYGSYVRHLAPFYPLIFYVIFKDNFNNQGEFDESFTRS